MSTRVTSSSIAMVLALLASILLIPEAYAGGRRRVVAVSPPSSVPQLTLVGSVGVSAGVIDAGAMAWDGGSRRSAVSTRMVTMRIGEPSAEPNGRATVSAFIETLDSRFSIRVDGVPLTTAPRVIRRNAPIGLSFSHRIEIEVPASAAEGPLHAQITWQVTTETP